MAQEKNILKSIIFVEGFYKTLATIHRCKEISCGGEFAVFVRPHIFLDFANFGFCRPAKKRITFNPRFI